MQSADLFDFAAVHLSSLEKYASHVPNNNNRKLRRIQEILTLVGPVQNHFTLRNISRELSLSKKTLVVIPYFAQVKWRTGESFLESRPLYLNSTYWSLRAQFENIVVGVQNQKDYDFITRDSGLRFYDVILMTINASGYTRLPVALIQHVQKCLLRKSHCPYSSFTYFFYSEADMVYNFRSFEKLVNYTFQAVSKKQHSIKTGKYKKLRSRELPPLILVPHRVMTYLPGHLNIVKKKQSYGKMDMLHSQSPIESYTEVSPQLSNQPYSCCMDLFNCTTRYEPAHPLSNQKFHGIYLLLFRCVFIQIVFLIRVQWRKLAHPEVKIHSYLGLPVVLANHHYFNGGEFRTCNLTSLKTCAGETG